VLIKYRLNQAVYLLIAAEFPSRDLCHLQGLLRVLQFSQVRFESSAQPLQSR